VREFIAAVRASISAATSPEDACEASRPRFSGLLADPGWLPHRYRESAPESGMGEGIGQWRLFRAVGGSLSLFSLAVRAGAQTPVGWRSPLHGDRSRGQVWVFAQRVSGSEA
jgi:hypothetical protein